MNILSNIIANLFHILGILLICSNLFRMEKKNCNIYKKIIVILIVDIANVLFNFLVKNINLELIFYFLCILLVMKMLYMEAIQKMIIFDIVGSIIMNLLEMIFSDISNSIFNILDIKFDYIEAIISSGMTVIIIAIISIILGENDNFEREKITRRFWIIFAIDLISNFSILAIFSIVVERECVDSTKLAYTLLYAVVTIGLFLQMFFIIYIFISRNVHKEKELLAKKYLEEQNNYYEYLKEREVETKKFRHDIRSHLYLLDKVYKEGKREEFETYLNDIKDKVDRLGIKVNVGNDIVNAILDKYFAEAKSKNVKLKVQGHFPMGCNISAYHLCTIFSNLLSNAVEAAQKAENKEVWVICSYTEKNIIIEVGNYFSGFSDNRKKLITTKKEKQYHGWGIKNVKDSVKECEGLMDIEIQEDSFIVSITLKNEGSKNEHSNSR